MDVKKTALDAVDTVADNTRQAAGAVGDAASQAAGFVKDKTGLGADGVREHMDVLASCGTKVGVVDRIEGNVIKLTKKDSADGMHHYLPLSAVASVDSHVHLSMDHKAFPAVCKDSAEACGM